MQNYLQVTKNRVYENVPGSRKILFAVVITLVFLFVVITNRKYTDEISEIVELQPTNDSIDEITASDSTISDEGEFQMPNYTENQLEQIERNKRCYQLNDSVKNVDLLDDIQKAPPKPDRSIFFIPTSCISDGQVTLNARESCAIESAASQNPNRDVFVIFVASVGFVANRPVSPLIVALQSFPNIHFRTVNIYELSKDTPAENWVKEDRIFLSPVYQTHMSDFVRLVILYKYGGIYFDTDFIVIKSVDELPPNFVILENKYINNSVLGFSSKGTGHGMVDKILRECIEKYSPSRWDFNGPFAVRRAVMKICNIEDDGLNAIDKVRPELCDGLKAMPTVTFFPLTNHKETVQTNPETVENSLKKITDEAIGIHTWSSVTRNIDILKSGPPMVYTIVAQKFCKQSYDASGLHFNKK